MSELAIAAVTATLRSLVQQSVSPADVTTLPLDRSAASGQTNRVNLFLYHVSPNAAWRNQAIPTKVGKGDTGREPLALNLHYLITAYGDDQREEDDHRLLGTAMRVLHDHAVLDRQQVINATGATRLRESHLEKQYEPVRITPSSLTIDEMSKLWTTFQTQYRVSAAYQASVVLIESRGPVKSSLPVLKRGEEDRGVEVVASLPGRLEGVEYRDLRERESPFPAAQLGDVVTLRGVGLPGMHCRVLFLNPQRRPTAVEPNLNVIARLRPEPGSNSEQVFVRLDPDLAQWQSGPLHVVVEQVDANRPSSSPPRRSPPLFFGLAPTIHNGKSLSAITNLEGGRRKLVIDCRPPIVRPPTGRPLDVSLVLSPTGSGQGPPPIAAGPPNVSLPGTVVFDVHQIPPGEYRVRLRVETVETVLMERNGAGFKFDDKQVIRL